MTDSKKDDRNSSHEEVVERALLPAVDVRRLVKMHQHIYRILGDVDDQICTGAIGSDLGWAEEVMAVDENPGVVGTEVEQRPEALECTRLGMGGQTLTWVAEL